MPGPAASGAFPMLSQQRLRVPDGFDQAPPGAALEQMQVELRDGQGTLTITRDGVTQTYTLDSEGRWVPDAEEQ